MHELGLTRDAVEMVIESSEAASANKVLSAYFTVGSGRDVFEPLFRRVFEQLTKKTIAEGCELVINRVPLTARCKACGLPYPVDPSDEATWSCPECCARDYVYHAGMEFTLDRVEIE